MVNTPATSGRIICQVAQKIKTEMKHISSDAHDAILRDNVEAVKYFHWDTVMLELQTTLITLLQKLVPRPLEKKQLICTLALQLLKSRNQRMGLLQRAVSVMLYRNYCTRQVTASIPNYKYIISFACRCVLM